MINEGFQRLKNITIIVAVYIPKLNYTYFYINIGYSNVIYLSN